jgi:DoxX-like family
MVPLQPGGQMPGAGHRAKEDVVFAAYVIITVVTIAANAWAAAADLAQPKWVLANMEEVGVPRSWLLPLAVLKGAGAAGLLLGLLGVRPLGIAAAAGLVLFFTGALATHLRARAVHNIAFPGAYFALATASAALAVAAH